MSEERFERGLSKRRRVLGDDYVNQSMQNADAFTQPLQELVTEYCWGNVWQREGLSDRDRSLINLAMITALNRPHELRKWANSEPGRKPDENPCNRNRPQGHAVRQDHVQILQTVRPFAPEPGHSGR